MESMGIGTLMIPDEVQRGMQETANPTLDVAGLRALRDDLRELLCACSDEFQRPARVQPWRMPPSHWCACAAL